MTESTASLTKPHKSPSHQSTTTRDPNEGHRPWLPISLLVVTTAALILPAVLLRRLRNTNLNKSASVTSLSDSSAPPRRVGTGPGRVLKMGPTGTGDIRRPASNLGGGDLSHGANALTDGNFNPALYTAKAFGIASLLVGVGTVVGVWGVGQGLGVHDMRGFADRMREVVSTKLPVLSARIHRALEVTNSNDTVDGGLQVESHDRGEPDERSGENLRGSKRDIEKWNWADAEKRLGDAFDRGGVGEWAQVVVREVEEEAKLERARRELEER